MSHQSIYRNRFLSCNSRTTCYYAMVVVLLEMALCCVMLCCVALVKLTESWLENSRCSSPLTHWVLRVEHVSKTRTNNTGFKSSTHMQRSIRVSSDTTKRTTIGMKRIDPVVLARQKKIACLSLWSRCCCCCCCCQWTLGFRFSVVAKLMSSHVDWLQIARVLSLVLWGTSKLSDLLSGWRGTVVRISYLPTKNETNRFLLYTYLYILSVFIFFLTSFPLSLSFALQLFRSSIKSFFFENDTPALSGLKILFVCLWCSSSLLLMMMLLLLLSFVGLLLVYCCHGWCDYRSVKNVLRIVWCGVLSFSFFSFKCSRLTFSFCFVEGQKRTNFDSCSSRFHGVGFWQAARILKTRFTSFRDDSYRVEEFSISNFRSTNLFCLRRPAK